MYAIACLTVDSTNFSIVSRTPFFASERSCKKVRLIIREIRYLFSHALVHLSICLSDRDEDLVRIYDLTAICFRVSLVVFLALCWRRQPTRWNLCGLCCVNRREEREVLLALCHTDDVPAVLLLVMLFRVLKAPPSFNNGLYRQHPHSSVIFKTCVWLQWSLSVLKKRLFCVLVLLSGWPVARDIFFSLSVVYIETWTRLG